MPAKTARPCVKAGCPNRAVPGRGTCADHTGATRRRTDLKRGTAAARGYDSSHRDTFRAGVLAKHPVCQLCRSHPATEADHWPLSRRELVAVGEDPNDPRHGRGLCKRCHSRETALHQPGHRWRSQA